ncbi:hypothetical protein ACFQZC_14005 [Streptacidiphilus monticola]
MATIVESGTPRAWAVDEALGRLLDAERGRQRDCLNLLAGRT